MCSVLIVEDDEGCAHSLSVRLKIDAQKAEYNLTVAFVKTLAKARELGHLYDAILLDLQLPDSPTMDTVYALRDLSRDLPPIFIVTGYQDHAKLAMMAIENGAEDFFDKDEFAFENLGLTRIVFGIARRNRKEACIEIAA